MKARILIVDDEEIVIRSCVRILGEEHEVDAVNSGAEALTKVAGNGYDVLILDIMMPGIGGLEVLQRVKEMHPEVDVIMVTGLSQIETAVRCMKLGAFDYLSKPFDPDELLAQAHDLRGRVVRGLLGRRLRAVVHAVHPAPRPTCAPIHCRGDRFATVLQHSSGWRNWQTR